MMMTMCLIFWCACERSEDAGRTCVEAGRFVEVGLGLGELATAFDPPETGTTTAGGRLVAVPHAERTRRDISNKE